jgi:hypothetical protein
MATKKTTRRKEAPNKTEQIRTDERFYPKLTIEQEKVIIMLSSGRTVADAGLSVGVGRTTIYDWMRKPAFQKAWKEEETRVLADLRKLVPPINFEAYQAIQSFLRDKRSSKAEKARIAERYLKDSGFLVLSDSAEEQKKQIEDAAQILAAVMAKHMGQ